MSVCAGVLAVGAVLCGCNTREYDGPRRFAVSGEVSFDGEVVDQENISFIPTSSEQRVSGGTIVDGEYAVPEPKGPNAGTYRIEMHWWKKTGEQYFDGDAQEYFDRRVEALPKRFHEDSELSVEVSDEQTTFDFDLKSE